jgi:hypothetical protein
LRFDLNPPRKSHEAFVRRCYRGVALKGSEIKHVDDRGPDVLPPGKDHNVVANDDCL